MAVSDDHLLAALIFGAAVLYSSVGHAGASGYLAAMALFSVPPDTMKPTALMLNVLVASIATFRFLRAGRFSWPVFWPLALVSVPCAFVGGFLVLPGDLYRPLVGCVLVFAALKSVHRASSPDPGAIRQPPRAGFLLAGASIGLLSGLTGVGGGIFLSPLLIFLRWSSVTATSGIAAAFILLNSMAGLAGLLTRTPVLPDALPVWAIAAVAGGFIGASYGSRRLGSPAIQRILALVLLIAGGKMILAT
jgi:uncharacterized membrane protein YfcA